MEIKGKTAIVTGGNSGIGKAIASALAEAGAKVVIGARRQDRNEAVAKDLARKFGVETLALETDVALEAHCERLVKETARRFGTVDILVNDAGIGGGETIAETHSEDFDRVLKTNLYGTFWCARAAYRQMRSNKGDPRGIIINVSSVAGKSAWSGTGAYSVSKFGVIALTQALADEGQAHNIKAAAICPGLVATPMTNVSGAEYLQPEDCAKTVMYLVGLSSSAWVTEIVLGRKGAS
jgi:3-oxoacyl-[acyl-carrier protein] reductase